MLLSSVHFSKLSSLNVPALINAFMFTRQAFYVMALNSNTLEVTNGPTAGGLPGVL